MSSERMLFVYASDLNAKYIHNGNRRGHMKLVTEKQSEKESGGNGEEIRMETRQSLAHQKMF